MCGRTVLEAAVHSNERFAAGVCHCFITELLFVARFVVRHLRWSLPRRCLISPVRRVAIVCALHSQLPRAVYLELFCLCWQYEKSVIEGSTYAVLLDSVMQPVRVGAIESFVGNSKER